jgi:hypothetical protein
MQPKVIAVIGRALLLPVMTVKYKSAITTETGSETV